MTTPAEESREPEAALSPGDRVLDTEGNEATVVLVEGGSALLAVESGPQLKVPLGLFTSKDGAWHARLSLNNLSFPVVEEAVKVSVRAVETGRGVRVHKRVLTRQESYSPEVLKDRLEVRRVLKDEVLPEGAVPKVRIEGDTIVLPVLEEVLVVTRQLKLKEEVWVTRFRERQRAPLEVSLEREEVVVTPLEPSSDQED